MLVSYSVFHFSTRQQIQTGKAELDKPSEGRRETAKSKRERMKKDYGCFHVYGASSNRIHLLSALQLALPAAIGLTHYNEKNKSIGHRRSSSVRCGVKLVRETSRPCKNFN